METALLIESQLDEAERLLLAPTAANLEQMAKQMADQMGKSIGPVLAALNSVTASAKVVPDVDRELVAFAERLQTRVGGLRALLEAAWQIRLGLARAAAAGLGGYSAAGSSENRPEFEAQTRLTATA